MTRKLECRKCGTFNRAGNVCMCSQSTATAGHRINLDRFLISDEDARKTLQDARGEIVEHAAMLVAEKNEKTMEQALIAKQQQTIAKLKADNERLRKALTSTATELRSSHAKMIAASKGDAK